MTLLEAIARQEGFRVPGSRAQRNHNPGNVNFGTFAQSHGAVHADDKGYAVFPSEQAGFAALAELLRLHYSGMTLRQALLRYAPPKGDPRGDNDSEAYLYNVTAWTGIQADSVIDPYV